MNNPAFFIGKPLFFKNKFYIYPPKISEVVTNNSFSQFLKVLTITQDDIQDELLKNEDSNNKYPTPFEFLLINCYHSAQFMEIVQNAFSFFIHKNVNILFEYKLIAIGDISQAQSIAELVTIGEEDYFDFQNCIREVCGDKPIKPPEPVNPNEDPRITAIKAKARARDRIKAKHASKDGISLYTCLVAICCMGIGITPLNIGEMSYAAIGPIMKMSQGKEKYNIDVHSLLAGADSKKVKPKYWIRNFDKD